MMTAGRIDLGLEVLCALPRTGPVSCETIAEVCGCSPRTIHRIEERALAKLRHPDIKAKLKPIMEGE